MIEHLITAALPPCDRTACLDPLWCLQLARCKAKIGGVDTSDPRDAELATLRAENARLREALTFYAQEWQHDFAGDPEVPGGTMSWAIIPEELERDEGRRARAALEDKP